MWNTLKGINDRSNLSSKLYILRKVCSGKLNECKNMIALITIILEIMDKLSVVGENIKNSRISAVFLGSLPLRMIL